MEAIRQLAAMYVIVLALNLLLTGLLWYRHRTPLYRRLFVVWVMGAVFVVIQGVPAGGVYAKTLQFLPAFFITFNFAHLVAGTSGVAVPSRLYLALFAAAPLVSAVVYLAGGPFWAVTFPASIAIALPALDTPLRALLRTESRPTAIGKAFIFGVILMGLHDLDYPFLGNRADMAAVGLSIALVIMLAISITAPMTVLETITDERAKVVAQNEFQRRFFANLTHELRTPLTMILAPLDAILAGQWGPLAPMQREYLEATRRHGMRLLRLISDLLELARLEEGFVILRPQPLELHGFLHGLLDDARPLAARKSLGLKLIGDASVTAMVDGEKLERALINLIANAIKFTESGAITVDLRRQGNAIDIAVIDTGIGIPAAQLPHLFERFRQGDDSVTRRYGGTGIGLAYAREIVELHGGRISIESTVGQGSRFVVHFDTDELAARAPSGVVQEPATPLAPLDSTRRFERLGDYRFAEVDSIKAATAESPPEASTASRILVVEDNPDIVRLLKSQLSSRHLVLTAADGEEGLAIARRERPDLVITDFMMPRMDGLTMIKALRADPLLVDLPIIMLTAKTDIEDRLAGRQAGADVYLTKPFSPRELDAAIGQQLKRRGRQVQSVMRAHVEGLELVSAGLAHEIQNPLNFIKNAQLLIAENVAKLRGALDGLPSIDADRAVAVERAQQKIGRMVESAGRGVERIEGVVGLMRRYAREGYPTQAAEIDLDRVVTDVAEIVAPRLEIDRQVTLELQDGSKPVRAVPEDLNQVVRSLVQNAVEATAPGGHITLRTRVEGTSVVFDVIDDGSGIAPEDLPRLFSPFFSTKTGNGRGLGLPIVRSVVTSCGGTVEVTSVPRTATTFRVRLPLAAPAVDKSRAGAPS